MVEIEERLPKTVAFGTSMLPFFGPGKNILLETVSADSIRLGDIITYLENSNALVSHRVIKIIKKNGGFAFMTKGDNRLNFDALVEDHQIIGKAIRIGQINLKLFRWRFSGWWIAQFSYVHGTIFQYLKKLFPKIRAPYIFRVAGNPLSWLDGFRKVVTLGHIWNQRYFLSRQGIKIKTFTPEDLANMFEIWNGVFPAHQTSFGRFAKKLCASRLFNPSNCLLIDQRGKLLGWALITFRNDHFGSPEKPKAGFVDVLAIADSFQNKNFLDVLIHSLLICAQKNKIKMVHIGPHLLENHVSAVPQTPLSVALTRAHFMPGKESLELRVSRAHYQSYQTGADISALVIRFAEASDEDALSKFSKRNHFRFEPNEIKKTTLIAVLNGQIVGFCRLLSDEQMIDFSELSWAWSVAESNVRAGYFFGLVVDRDFRRNGIGSILAAKAFDFLFQVGCDEIALTIKREGFYEDFYKRFGFQRKARYLTWKKN